MLDLDLVGVRRNFEDVLAPLAEDGALFGDHRADDGAEGIQPHTASASAAVSAEGSERCSALGAGVLGDESRPTGLVDTPRPAVNVRVSSATAVSTRMSRGR